MDKLWNILTAVVAHLSPMMRLVSQLEVEAFSIQAAAAASNSVWSPSEPIFSPLFRNT